MTRTKTRTNGAAGPVCPLFSEAEQRHLCQPESVGDIMAAHPQTEDWQDLSFSDELRAAAVLATKLEEARSDVQELRLMVTQAHREQAYLKRRVIGLTAFLRARCPVLEEDLQRATAYGDEFAGSLERGDEPQSIDEFHPQEGNDRRANSRWDVTHPALAFGAHDPGLRIDRYSVEPGGVREAYGLPLGSTVDEHITKLIEVLWVDGGSGGELCYVDGCPAIRLAGDFTCVGMGIDPTIVGVNQYSALATAALCLLRRAAAAGPDPEKADQSGS